VKLGKFKSLWESTGTGADGVAVEASEARFRTIILTIAMVIGPPLILFLYYRAMFPGLVNTTAIDFAQLGRNLSQGRGFVTYILKPLALTHGDNALRQPEMIHGPLYPLILALAFGALGAKDAVVAGVSGIFYLLTIPVLYRLGVRVFNRAVALITVLIYTFNALMLEYAISGLHITLFVFLTTSLLLAVYNIAAHNRNHTDRQQFRVPRAQLVLAGLLTGALYLTDYDFFWFVPVMIFAILWLNTAKRVSAFFWFITPLVVLIAPWMARNALVAGNPIFGLRGYEIWMNTALYPEMSAYRMAPAELIPSVQLFKAVVKKVLLGTGQAIRAFPQVTASWVLAFFLPSLLFRFTDVATNAVRRVMMYCFVALLAGTLVFQISMPMFVSVIPGMLMFAVAYLIYLVQQARLSRGSLVWLGMLMTGAVVYPLISDTLLIGKASPLRDVPAVKAIVARSSDRTDVCISDEPSIVAWYADRPSILIPRDYERVKEARRRFGARWLVLTERSIHLSQEWRDLYTNMLGWNMANVRARNGKDPVPGPYRVPSGKHPLNEGLNGFMAIEPLKDTSPFTVVAVAPATKSSMGEGSR